MRYRCRSLMGRRVMLRAAEESPEPTPAVRRVLQSGFFEIADRFSGSRQKPIRIESGAVLARWLADLLRRQRWLQKVFQTLGGKIVAKDFGADHSRAVDEIIRRQPDHLKTLGGVAVPVQNHRKF